jgi:hypothetical protein
MANLTGWEVFGLTSLSAFVGAAATLIGHVLKEVVFPRSFETWKANKAASASLHALSAPMFRAACDLNGRLEEIYSSSPDYLETDALVKPEKLVNLNDVSDPHYRHYKLRSTIYRFAAFWGWVELFRFKAAAIQGPPSEMVTKIETVLKDLRIDLADGRLNTNKDWHMWKDRLVFREELRGIGERMIAENDQVVGYATFCDFHQHPEHNDWLDVCYNFFLNLGDKKDFRRVRIFRAVAHLYELMEAIDPTNIPVELAEKRISFVLQKES